MAFQGLQPAPRTQRAGGPACREIAATSQRCFRVLRGGGGVCRNPPAPASTFAAFGVSQGGGDVHSPDAATLKWRTFLHCLRGTPLRRAAALTQRHRRARRTREGSPVLSGSVPRTGGGWQECPARGRARRVSRKSDKVVEEVGETSWAATLRRMGRERLRARDMDAASPRHSSMSSNGASSSTMPTSSSSSESSASTSVLLADASVDESTSAVLAPPLPIS
jgi:hypothetical protein